MICTWIKIICTKKESENLHREDLIREVIRKAIHLTSIIIVLTYYFFGKEAVLLLLTVYLIVVLGLEYFRIECGEKIPVVHSLSLIHISEPTRLGMISYAVFCLKKKKIKNKT